MVDDLKRAIDALEGLLNIVHESNGVSGFHLNGDIAAWDEFEAVRNAEAALSTYRKSEGGDG